MAEDDFPAMLRRTRDATQRSPRDVVTSDAADPMADSDFDDAVYLALLGSLPTVDDVWAKPPAVRAYLATRMVEWEMGSGGIDGALEIAAEYFDEAKAGYQLVGQEYSAALLERIRAAEDDDELDRLSAAIEGSPWNGVPWADTERIALVRANRDQFLID